MNIKRLQAKINAIHQKQVQVDSSIAQDIIKDLLNLVEEVAGDNQSLESDIQMLKNEVNRLKGEQGKPEIKSNQTDISSEKEQKRMLMLTEKTRQIRKRVVGRICSFLV